IRQRAQKNGVHHAEDRRIRADTQPQYQQSEKREAGVLDQGTNAESRVQNEVLEPRSALHVPALLLDLLRTAELDRHRSLRLFRSHPGRYLRLKGRFPVKPQLSVQLLLQDLLTE